MNWNRWTTSMPAWAIVLLLTTAMPTESTAQEPSASPATGSIAGTVTKEGKPAPDVGVVLNRARDMNDGGEAVQRTLSAKDGTFLFDNVEQGSYNLNAFAAGYTLSDSPATDQPQSVNVGEGERVSGVSVALIRGGAITGRLLDADGQTVSGQTVRVSEVLSDGSRSWLHLERMTEPSDDRGVYRVFGLRPGRYVVSAGTLEEGVNYPNPGRAQYVVSFHGGGHKPEEAKGIEVTAGGEARDADIVLRRIGIGFIVRGRVVDGVTRKPVEGLMVGIGPVVGGKTLGFAESGLSGADGAFTASGIPPGSYRMTVIPNPLSTVAGFSDVKDVQVADRDVADVVLEMQPAAELRGSVVLLDEGRTSDVKVTGFGIFTALRVANLSGAFEATEPTTFGPIEVRADGSFVAGGRRAGLYRFVLNDFGPAQQLYIDRIEVDGVRLEGPLRVPEQSIVENIRIFVGHSRGILRGRVVHQGGSVRLEEYSVVVFGGEVGVRSRFVPVDSSGKFLAENLRPGEYHLEALRASGLGPTLVNRAVKVNVPASGTVEATLELVEPDASGELP